MMPRFSTVQKCFVLLASLGALLGSVTRAADGEGEHTNDSSEHRVWDEMPLGLDPSRVIDLALENEWRIRKVEPSLRISDAQFLRRVTLDLIGRIPRSSETAEFLQDTNSDKRERWVDRLLSSDEHASHLAEVLDAVFIGRTEADAYKRRTQVGWQGYLTESIKQNRPWSDMVREMVLARPNTNETRGAVWYLYSRKDKPQDIAEAVSKDIFGVRVDCAQCHDHPLSAEIEQRHYWGLVAFFNRSKNVDTPKGPRVAESAIGGFSNFSDLDGKAQPNRLVYFGKGETDLVVDEVRPADGAKEEDKEDLYEVASDSDPKVPKFSRRQKFVEEILRDHPLVSKAAVNRFWGWMMGRGLVHPVDAMDSFHPASHPQLLNWLARDFAASNYNVRRLLRSIALSRAYQLDSRREDFIDPQWFAAGQAKPLTAEALHRSILIAMDPDDVGRWDSVEQRVAFARQFPDVFPEESLSTVAQGLLLTNGESINQLCTMKHSKFLRSLQTIEDPAAAVNRLFGGTLGRQPDSEELAKCMEYLKARDTRRDTALEQMAWALITSAEFRFNH